MLERPSVFRILLFPTLQFELAILAPPHRSTRNSNCPEKTRNYGMTLELESPPQKAILLLKSRSSETTIAWKLAKHQIGLALDGSRRRIRESLCRVNPMVSMCLHPSRRYSCEGPFLGSIPSLWSPPARTLRSISANRQKSPKPYNR